MKRITHPASGLSNQGSRTSAATRSLNQGIGYDETAGALVPVVDFHYPDEGDEPAPVVRDAWTRAPLVEKCLRPFAQATGPDALPMLDKRLEVLRYALREAVEKMDIRTIVRLAAKAQSTEKRITAEQLAANTPGLREIHDDIVIEDSPARGRVLIQFAELPPPRIRRLVRMCGFFGAGDGITWWRKRTFLRGENIALSHARYCVESILQRRAQDAATEQAGIARITAEPLCA